MDDVKIKELFMTQVEQGYGGPGIYPEAQRALDHIKEVGCLLESSEDVPCLERQLTSTPIGTDADPLLRTTLAPEWDGTSTWRGGENAGHHALTIRQCGRSACTRVAQLVISSEGNLLDAETRPLRMTAARTYRDGDICLLTPTDSGTERSSA
jgi:hypothetical protein